MAVYQILGKIMDEKGLSIADVARICNLPDSTVRGIIRRHQETIALEVAFKLSDGLSVSLEKLNGMPEKKPTPRDEGGQAEKLAAALAEIGIDVEGLTDAQISLIARLSKVALEE